MSFLKKYAASLLMLALFVTVGITLWLTLDDLFYLFNFSYIGCSIAFGLALYVKKYIHARRVVQLLVGLYMLVYLGLICNENMKIRPYSQRGRICGRGFGHQAHHAGMGSRYRHRGQGTRRKEAYQRACKNGG